MTCDLTGSTDGIIGFAGKHGYGLLNKVNGKTKYIKQMWSPEEKADGKDRRMRMNDGKIDSEGRFWAASIRDPLEVESAPEGEAYFSLTIVPSGLLTMHRGSVSSGS